MHSAANTMSQQHPQPGHSDPVHEADALHALTELFPHLKLAALQALRELFPLGPLRQL